MNDRPTIIITGSSGLVGSNLVSYFAKSGFHVRAFQRSLPKNRNSSISYHHFDLADVHDEGFQGADYLVHCAYRPFVSRRERESGVNIDIEGTKKIISLARAYGIKIIFLSTTSAHPESQSYYARNKFQAERLFDVQTDLILKLGLVLGGRGGLFGRILSSLRKYSIVPLIGGGRQCVQTIALDDLCRIIEAGIKKNLAGMFRIAHPSVVIMKELYQGIADIIGARPIFIPVPLATAYGLTRLLESTGPRLPFTSENILGLTDLRTFDTTHDLEKFGLQTKDLRATLARMKHE